MHRDAIVAIVAIVVIVTSLEAPQKLNNMWNRHGQGVHVASMQVRSIYKLVDSRTCGTTLVGRAWTRCVQGVDYVLYYFQVLKCRLESPLLCQPGIKAQHRGLSELPSAQLLFILRLHDAKLMSLSCKHIEVNIVASPMPGGAHYYNYS